MRQWTHASRLRLAPLLLLAEPELAQPGDVVAEVGRQVVDDRAGRLVDSGGADVRIVVLEFVARLEDAAPLPRPC
jgi:hypothetical protein